MTVAEFLTMVTTAVQTIFSLELTHAYEGHGNEEPTTIMFTVENPTSNPAFVWPYELSPALINTSAEYRTSALSGIGSRIYSDLLNQWIATQAVRPITQPIDRV